MIAKILSAGTLLIGAMSLGGCGGASSESETGSESGAVGAGADRADGAGGDDVDGALGEMTMGAEDAPLTVIEYASLTCPACAAFHQSVFPDIKSEYVDEGKVRFVFREFPTPPVDRSAVASMLARCAADRGGDEAYFLMLDSLFASQESWAYGGDPRGALLKIAAQAGIDESAFDECTGREDLIALLNANVEDARERYGVRSTPSFIVDGALRNFSSVEAMRTALDEALAKVDE